LIAAVVAAAIGLLLLVADLTADTGATPVVDAPVSTPALPGGSSVEATSIDESPTRVVETGDQLVWRTGPTIDDVLPLAIVEFRGSEYLFVTQPAERFDTTGSGLIAWWSDDGDSWASMGMLIEPPAKVRAVTAGQRGFVAAGTDLDGRPVVWSSADGSDWAENRLPVVESPPSSSPSPFAIAASGDLVVVVGRVRPGEGRPATYRAVQELVGFPIEGMGVNAHPGADGQSVHLTLEGPLGLDLLSVSTEALALPKQDRSFFRVEPGPPALEVWSSIDGTNWSSSTLDETYSAELAAVPDGVVMTTLDGGAGPLIRFSHDGIVWENLGLGPDNGFSVVPWGSSFIGTAYGNSGLSVSSTGQNWEPITVSSLLPAGFQWNISMTVAGYEGVAAVAQGWDTSAMADGIRLTPAILVKDGFTLSIDETRFGGLVLRRDGVKLYEVGYYSGDVGPFVERLDGSRRYVVDLETGSVTFIDPDTSERFVTFSLDERRQLSEFSRLETRSVVPEQTVIFSPDARTWSASNPADFAGERGLVSKLQVTADGLIAVVSNPMTLLFAPGPPDVRVYRAGLPDRPGGTVASPVDSAGE